MNPLPPNTDELVSAYLDGQATPDEVVTVESNPELMERVEATRRLTVLLGQPMAPPPAQKEAHISAALDAFDALFTADDAAVEAVAAVPPLAAVQTLTEQEPASPTPERATPEGVTSLAIARERRRPRRFNTGIIAAAAAAVLLFVAVASFGFRGGQDSLEVANAGQTTDTSDAAGADDAAEPMIEAAMDNDEAMDDDSRGAQLSEIGPAPTAAPPQAASSQPADDAAANDLAADDMADEAMEEEADGDSAAMDDSEGAAEDPAAQFRLFQNDFPDRDTLLFELKQLPLPELAERADAFEPGLFPGCQQDLAELADSETPTLVGEAFVAGELVEIHQLIDGDVVTIVLVDPTDCSVLPETP